MESENDSANGGANPSDDSPTQKPRASKWETVRKWFLRLNVAYAGVLLFFLALLEFWGESNRFLSVPMFLPAWGWCIPSLCLIPICAIVNWRTIGIHVVLLVIVSWLYMDYEVNSAKDGPVDLTVLAYNYGEHRGTEFGTFAEAVEADVFVLVDAAGRTPKYKTRYPDMHFAEVGEFLIISKYEVINANAAVNDLESGVAFAARFELDHPKGRIAVYAAHLPTPRPLFKDMRNPRHLLSFGSRREYQYYLDNKIALTRDLLREVEMDDLPCVVVGDMNTPPRGVIYRRLRKQLVDCFDERGSGYGHTFPGDAKKLYAFRQPWLRIDYIFRDDNWETCDFVTETGRNTQHLAVAAKLRLK